MLLQGGKRQALPPLNGTGADLTLLTHRLTSGWQVLTGQLASPLHREGQTTELLRPATVGVRALLSLVILCCQWMEAALPCRLTCILHGLGPWAV